MTLDQDEAELLVRVARIATNRRGDGDDDDYLNRLWVFRCAITAVSRAMIRDGELPLPLAAELRPETYTASKKVFIANIFPSHPSAP